MNLVTGATGFLGSHLAERLAERGEPVRALVRPSSNTRLLERLGIDLVEGDLADAESLGRAVAGVHHVYHCAALASDWGTWPAFVAANVTGVENLLRATSRADVARFIHVSTTDVYGHPDRPVAEDAPFRRRGWPYGDTKIAAEELAWRHHHEHGLPVTVIRPANIYGPRSHSFVVEIADLLRAGSMVHVGRGRRPGGLTYVANVVDLILRAADSPQAIGQAYNVTDDLAVSFRRYVNDLADGIGAPRPRWVIPYHLAYGLGWMMESAFRLARAERRPPMTRMAVEVIATHQGFSTDKARRELNYAPAIGFEEGLTRVVAWLGARG